uniref:Uncharacterized protein n=1 Tax=Knipowitschia caucasica TaxID=637954 RepID=A0AAV2J8M4_KNICA
MEVLGEWTFLCNGGELPGWQAQDQGCDLFMAAAQMGVQRCRLANRILLAKESAAPVLQLRRLENRTYLGFELFAKHCGERK